MAAGTGSGAILGQAMGLLPAEAQKRGGVSEGAEGVTTVCTDPGPRRRIVVRRNI